MPISIIKNRRGVELIMTVLLMTIVLFLAAYLLEAALTENRIAISQSFGAKTYYLAEAGIQDMVWKLKNDSVYKQNFETNPAWTATFSRIDPFGAGNGSYTVTITNSSLAHGLIVSTGAIALGNGVTSQRIVKTSVFRAMGQSPVEDNGDYADGNIDISYSVVNFYNGSAHSNNVFDINGASAVNIDNDLNAVNQYIKSWLASVNVGGSIHAANYPPAAATIAMPAVDFDSASTTSLRNRATIIYNQNEFDNLMKNNQDLTLPGPITYVDGDVELKGAQNLIVNGLLVVGRDLIVGHSLCRGSRCGNSSLTVNHTVGQASGVLAKRKIYFESWSGAIDATGAIYANDQLTITSLPLGYVFNATGGLISRKLTITGVWRPINIYYDNVILTEVFGATNFSPTLTVEHWEEEY